MPNNNLEYTLRLKDLFSKTMQGAANQVKGLDSKMSGLKNSMSSLGGMVAGAFSVGAVVSFGKAVIDSLKNYEYFHASLKTLLKGNENATASLESQLIKLAATTPFELTEVQTATKQLLAYGFKAGEVIETIRTLGDVSAGTGNNIGDVVYLYGTLRTSGRVALTDVNQFANRGIPIWESLAKNMKLTTKEVREFVGQGKVGFKDVEKAFQSMTGAGGQFFGMMDAQSKTVGGQLSNMADSWEQLKVQVGKSQKGIIAGTVSFFSEMLNAFGSYFEQQNRMEEAFAKYGGKGDSFLDKIRNNFGLGSGLGGKVSKNTEYDAYIQSTMASKLSNTQKELKLNQEIVKISKLRASGFLSEDDYTNKLSQLKGAMDIMKGNKDISTMKENPTLGADGKSLGGETSASKSLGTGTEVTGQRPQSLTINITKLVESLNVQTTNLTEGTAKIKEMVSKALLEAVNDANLTAMA
jgi:tape measure domain-containing protein